MLAIDCGSGGTRIWRAKKKGGVERVKWPSGGAPVLSRVLPTDEGRRDFAHDVKSLAAPCFIGATAGLRHAQLTGDISEADIEALRSLLPATCTFRILSPLEEAQFELASLRQHAPDATAMISMGGKSMQVGSEGNLFSLPFAMHLGDGMLRRAAEPWPDRVAATALAYESRCDEAAAESERLGLLDGVVHGVTDTVDVARCLKLVNRPPIPARSVVDALDACVAHYERRDPSSLGRADVTLLARVLALRTVARRLRPSCALCFRDDFCVTWTEGYLHAATRPAL